MSKRRKNPFPTWEEMLDLEAKYGCSIGSRLSLARPLAKDVSVEKPTSGKAVATAAVKTGN